MESICAVLKRTGGLVISIVLASVGRCTSAESRDQKTRLSYRTINYRSLLGDDDDDDDEGGGCCFDILS